jgi:hypothetical protein
MNENQDEKPHHEFLLRPGERFRRKAMDPGKNESEFQTAFLISRGFSHK